MGKVITVVSGKGGVGKTTIAAALAVLLAADNNKVLCIDGDVGLGNLDIVLGLDEVNAFDFSDVFNGNASVEECAVHHDTINNLSFINAPAQPLVGEPARLALTVACEAAKQLYDFVIIDAPAGIAAAFEGAVTPADMVIVVTTTDNSAIRDAEKTVACVKKQSQAEIRLIVNRVVHKNIIKSYATNVDDIIDSVSAQLIGIIPEDPALIVISNLGIPIVKSKAVAAKTLRLIARRVKGEQVPLAKIWKK